RRHPVADRERHVLAGPRADAGRVIAGPRGGAPDMKLAPEAGKVRFYSPLGNALFPPGASGRRPPLVLFPPCGGVGADLRYWAEEALNRGFVVLVLDSLGPRNVKTLCAGPTPVNLVRGAKDALDVSAYLASLDFVDPNRIALMGFSWGAMAGLYASSKSI